MARAYSDALGADEFESHEGVYFPFHQGFYIVEVITEMCIRDREGEPWPHRHECIRISFTQTEELLRKGLSIVAAEVRKAYSLSLIHL